MDQLSKAALILGTAIVIAVSVWVYFSPYQSCVRGLNDEQNARRAPYICARALGGVD